MQFVDEFCYLSRIITRNLHDDIHVAHEFFLNTCMRTNVIYTVR